MGAIGAKQASTGSFSMSMLKGINDLLSTLMEIRCARKYARRITYRTFQRTNPQIPPIRNLSIRLDLDTPGGAKKNYFYF
jgi:hypothetical protein